MDRGFDWVVSNGGIDTEAHYSYHANKGVCDIQRENWHVVTIDGYKDGAPKPTNLSVTTVCYMDVLFISGKILPKERGLLGLDI